MSNTEMIKVLSKQFEEIENEANRDDIDIATKINHGEALIALSRQISNLKGDLITRATERAMKVFFWIASIGTSFLFVFLIIMKIIR